MQCTNGSIKLVKSLGSCASLTVWFPHVLSKTCLNLFHLKKKSCTVLTLLDLDWAALVVRSVAFTHNESVLQTSHNYYQFNTIHLCTKHRKNVKVSKKRVKNSFVTQHKCNVPWPATVTPFSSWNSKDCYSKGEFKHRNTASKLRPTSVWKKKTPFPGFSMTIPDFQDWQLSRAPWTLAARFIILSLATNHLRRYMD